VAVRIHSTLTGQTEELVPIYPDNVLRMYVCGLTPKFHTHVGHARVFVAMDVVRRYLEYRGYQVKYVQNFTDVDDKIIQRAQESGDSAEAVARIFMQAYFANMDRLNVRRADEYPTVTGYMERIVEFIAGLVEGGNAYPSSEGDVWFDVASFPEYGKLSKRDLNSQLVAARKELEPGKKDPRDFALWKAAKAGEPSWPSPWGRGRPGWHIECSAMARETLGDQLDIHGGGADLIFPHHENEIAQSESLTHKAPFVRHWAHAGLVTVDDEKMANSGQNFFTLESLLGTYEPAPVRLYLIGTHYRSPLAFLVEPGADGAGPKVRGVEDARAALGRLRRALGDEPLAPGDDLDREAVARFEAAMAPTSTRPTPWRWSSTWPARSTVCATPPRPRPTCSAPVAPWSTYWGSWAWTSSLKVGARSRTSRPSSTCCWTSARSYARPGNGRCQTRSVMVSWSAASSSKTSPAGHPAGAALTDLLYGRHPILEALRAARRRVHRVLVAHGTHGLDDLLREAQRHNTPVQTIERRQLDRMLPGGHHQGVLAEAGPFRYARLQDLLVSTHNPLILMLDSLQDPQNFGTLLRTAQACGVDGVVIPEHRSVGVTPAVVSASAGAVEHLRIARETNLTRAIQSLKARNVWVYGLVVDAQRSYWHIDWTGASALVVGSEGPGLGRLVRESCDELVSIPMAPGAVQSLNASVAGSLVLYEAYRQRASAAPRPHTSSATPHPGP
jgi:cysteinyl-tRNA synthetase